MEIEKKEVQSNTYMGKRYYIKTTDAVKSVKLDMYGETLIPNCLPTHSKDGKPNPNLVPFMDMLIRNYRYYSNNSAYNSAKKA